jgi:hypothetical protein
MIRRLYMNHDITPRGYRRKVEALNLLVLSETITDPEISMMKREIISESVVEHAGVKIPIVRFKEVLQSTIPDGASRSSFRNWNRRGYMTKTVMKALDTNPIIQFELTAGPNKSSVWCAEYGHPWESDPKAALQRQNIVDPKFICKKTNKYWVESYNGMDLIMGESETLPGGWGDVLASRILGNLPAMASIRSIGKAGADGIVMDDLWVICFDSVVRQSHKEAMQVGKAEIVLPTNFNETHTMNESAIMVPLNDNDAATMILSENTRNIHMAAAMMNFDPSTISIVNENVTMSRISSDGMTKETLYLPFKSFVGMNYMKLF